MQVVENTCIGHEISLRKISEPLALKALYTSNSTTTRNAVVQKVPHLSGPDVAHTQQRELRDLQLSAIPPKRRVPHSLPRQPWNMVTCRDPRKLLEFI